MRASNATVPRSLTLCLLMSSLLRRNTNFHLGQFPLEERRELAKGWAGLALRSQEACGEAAAGSAVAQTTALRALKYSAAVHEGKLRGSAVGGTGRVKAAGSETETTAAAAGDSLQSPALCCCNQTWLASLGGLH